MKILNEENFKEFISQERSVVTFSAAWCGPCKAYTPVLEKVEQEKEYNNRVAKVDVDESSNIAAEYGIRSVPTTIVFSNGSVVEKKVGSLEEATVKSLLKS